MKKPFHQRVGDFLEGKGFYIVLFLCVAAIGIGHGGDYRHPHAGAGAHTRPAGALGARGRPAVGCADSGGGAHPRTDPRRRADPGGRAPDGPHVLHLARPGGAGRRLQRERADV